MKTTLPANALCLQLDLIPVARIGILVPLEMKAFIGNAFPPKPETLLIETRQHTSKNSGFPMWRKLPVRDNAAQKLKESIGLLK